jgi:DNA-binding response OmpR family regulator
MHSVERPASPSKTRHRIFVVEDDADILRLISHNLQGVGYEVQSFLNGSWVLAQALEHPPSLFLLDVMLPGTSGFDLCRQIRQISRLAGTPIIFLSARSEEADCIQGLELGGDDYIIKPFSPRELVARVRTVLRTVGQEPREVLHFPGLEIDSSSLTVRVEGRTVLFNHRT